MSQILEFVPDGCARHRVVRYETGELAGGERRAFESHLGSCARCAATLADLVAEKRAFQVAIPFSAFERAVEERTGRRRRLSWRAILWPLCALGAAAALLLVPRTEEQPWDGVKGGGAVLRVFARAESGARAVEPGEALGAGDALRLQAGAGGRRFLLVVSVDADGRVQPWLAAGGQSVPAGEGPTFVPGSLVLDEDPRPERLFALASDRPLTVAEVEAATRAAARAEGGVEKLERIPNLEAEQASFLVRKR